MWELDHKESWAPRKWFFQILVLEKTLESPLDSKENKQNNPEYSLERMMLELKLQYFSHLMWRNSWKKPCAGKDWRQKEEGAAEDEMVW